MLALGLSLYPAPAGARPKLPADQLATISRGDVVTFSEKVKGSGVMMGKAMGLVYDEPEAALYTLLDVAAYQHYLPRMKGSRVVRARGSFVYAVVETHFPWPVKDAWVYLRFQRRTLPGRVYEVTWSMVNGTMKHYSGQARIEPWTADTKQTLITYQLRAEPNTAAPDSVVSKGVRRVAEVFVHRLRLRTKALRTFKKLPPNLASLYK